MREQKKQATREALRAAALRLALERGPEHVRVDDIAEAAGVSPRTYNDYYSSREQAIVAAVTAEREARVAAAVAARPADVRLADAVIGAIVDQYTDPGEHGRDELLLITSRPMLREAFVNTATTIEDPLADAIARRLDDENTARVLAASVAAAVRVALQRWIQPLPASSTTGGLVTLSGSPPDLIRAALAPLAPALDAAETNSPARSPRRR
ncbi:TetR/AcrR family transcriptional regulator [Spirillospora sp. CA-142024]|uniref:TetR/AcrR family transcriptional regulator n=1 Tax=Spirillospora sp. CA-142024 TaxID=3240036 RepID=UPI003D8BBE2D